MEYIGFEIESDAFRYRNHNGGWLFIAADRKEFIWFSTQFTMTRILQHRVTRGLAGIVTCARTLDEALNQTAASAQLAWALPTRTQE
jgi:hypothetical protein